MRFVSAFGFIGLHLDVLGVIFAAAGYLGPALAAWAVGSFFIVAVWYEARRSD